jgi:hypothetical protein
MENRNGRSEDSEISHPGVQGEQGEADRGYDAEGKLNDLITGTLNTQAGGAFNQGQQNNKNTQDILRMIAKALGTGAGAVFGGPGGAAVGAGISSKIFG